MTDIMMTMYDAFNSDPELKKHVTSIKFFDYPNANDIKDCVIVIDDLTVPIPGDFADNDNLTHRFIYQVDLFLKPNTNTNGRLLSSRLILRIQRIMQQEFNFYVSASGKPEYSKEHNLFQQTVSFTGKRYVE